MTELGGVLLMWIGGGPVDAALLDGLRRRIETTFGVPTTIQTLNGPPEDTLDPRRGQRSSTKILRWLLGRMSPGPAKVLGVTDADLFIPVLTFVFGEAQMDGPAAVVSTARLGYTYDGRPASPEAVEARLIKECLHELGHTFGLVHCRDPVCVMARSNSILDVDQKQATFCEDCRQRLRDRSERRETP
jgi:archaemetzincin